MIKKSNRRIAREKCMQLLYSYQLEREGLSNLASKIFEDISNSHDKEFGEKLANLVIANEESLNNIIKERVSNWELDRIAVLDRILIKMGMVEILFFEDIPPKVSINEVIDIAKEFSTSNSGKFINGILDSLLTDLKKDGKLNKVGRGLIDQNLSTN